MTKLIILILLSLISCTKPGIRNKFNTYHRSEWPHWSDTNKDCLNTRHEILKMRSNIPVIYNRKGCGVTSGEWNDYYFPEVHTLSKMVDIDHLIPLKHAHENGAANWSKSQKEIFSNDPENLVITNLKYNRKKGAKGINEWLPVHRPYACKYIKDWLKIKKKYSLYISGVEMRTISAAKCLSINYE